MPKMKAAVFVEPGRIVLDEKPVPDVGPLDALIRITTTTICGTDVHILKGEYPVARGLTIGHEPVGVIEKLGSAVQGYREGQRVIAGAITPERPQQCLSVRLPLTGRRRHAARVQADRRLEIRQHDRRLSGRIRPGARRHGQSGARPGRPDRRAGSDVPRHHVNRLLWRREGSDQHRRYRRRLRAGTDRPVRHGRRQAVGATTIIGVDTVPERLDIARRLGR